MPRRDEETERVIDDELIGLDRDDPEVQAFAEHLRRMRGTTPGYTVEGYLAGVRDFAESANRSVGRKRLAALIVVALLLVCAGHIILNALGFVLTTFI